jgi:hypothetical protein
LALEGGEKRFITPSSNCQALGVRRLRRKEA